MRSPGAVHSDKSSVAGRSPTPLLNIVNAVCITITGAVTYVVRLPAGLPQLIRTAAIMLALGFLLLALFQVALQKIPLLELTF